MMFLLSLQVSQHLKHLRTPFLELNFSYLLNLIISAKMQLVLAPISSSLKVNYFLDQFKTASYLAVTGKLLEFWMQECQVQCDIFGLSLSFLERERETIQIRNRLKMKKYWKEEVEEEEDSIRFDLSASILLIPIVIIVISRNSKIAIMELIMVNCLIRKKIQMKMKENLKKN